jgi:pimeloyl-ACP methyl ester carboxylesterase
MQENEVLCLSPAGFHEMHYVEWGARDNPRIVICVHGLSRNCRDFDTLAQALEADFRVVCPDIVGRGKSDWLVNKAGYVNAQYAADATTLIARLTADGAREILWVGTSMGGIIGMMLAALPDTPIRRLVLNDVGGIVPAAALARIVAYLGRDPRFATFKELELCVRTISAPFGPLTDAQWEHLTRHNGKQHADGNWGPLVARRGFGFVAEGYRCGNDATRPARALGRIPRRRARADADERGPDRRGARFSAFTLKRPS